MSFYTSDQVNLDQESFPAFLGQDDAILCDPSSSLTFETIFEPFGSSDSSEYQQTPYNTLREQFPAANVDIAHLDTQREIDHPQSLESATLQRLIDVEAEIRRSEASRARSVPKTISPSLIHPTTLPANSFESISLPSLPDIPTTNPAAAALLSPAQIPPTKRKAAAKPKPAPKSSQTKAKKPWKARVSSTFVVPILRDANGMRLVPVSRHLPQTQDEIAGVYVQAAIHRQNVLATPLAVLPGGLQDVEMADLVADAPAAASRPVIRGMWPHTLLTPPREGSQGIQNVDQSGIPAASSTAASASRQSHRGIWPYGLPTPPTERCEGARHTEKSRHTAAPSAAASRPPLWPYNLNKARS